MTTRKITKKRKPNEPNPVYCNGCGRFLMYEAIKEGAIRIKCRHCKGWTELDIQDGHKQNRIESGHTATKDPLSGQLGHKTPKI